MSGIRVRGTGLPGLEGIKGLVLTEAGRVYTIAAVQPKGMTLAWRPETGTAAYSHLSTLIVGQNAIFGIV